ncbi:hypothetical protein Scep_000674 [Stephania cephalantha]|uniref:Phosphatidic acid phosphatase type 2/haloperoxidase domain-containing protein n=1 Tax=Stephania cephalantha TaxID=152367 RepID=A0AAP0L808_9MAGN
MGRDFPSKKRRWSRGVRALEKDHVLIDGQMDFSPDLASGGLQSTLNRLSKWIVAILFGAYVIWRHDAEAMWAVIGSILNVLLSIALKHTLKQERPVSTSESDHGMPSSHAQSLLYAAVFTVLSLVKYFGMNGATLTIGILTLTMGLYFSWLRVSMRRHTVGQVVVGAIVGSIFSVLWFKSWDAFVLKAFVSHLWVRIVVVLGGAGFCLGFLLYVIRYWLVD